LNESSDGRRNRSPLPIKRVTVTFGKIFALHTVVLMIWTDRKGLDGSNRNIKKSL
jgi:hypothetical protein